MKFHSNKFRLSEVRILYYDINIIGGQSGSPVFKAEENSKLVGMYKEYSPVEKINMAVMITS